VILNSIKLKLEVKDHMEQLSCLLVGINTINGNYMPLTHQEISQDGK